MAGWATADLVSKLLTKLGRGNAGVSQFDEVWTPVRTYDCLADAQEYVYTDLLPLVPRVFISQPIRLTTADGGITYDFPDYPFGHAEVYAREDGGRQLFGTSYPDRNGDFVFEGNKLRMPGDRPRSYAGGGPWVRYGGHPLRIAADQEPSLSPEPARVLIHYRSLIEASETWGAELDPGPWEKRYAEARMKWLLLWQTQSVALRPVQVGSWWLTLDSQF